MREVWDKLETGVSKEIRHNKNNNTEIPDVFLHIILPYKGKESHKMVQTFKKYLARVLLSDVKSRFVRSWGRFFQLRIKSVGNMNLMGVWERCKACSG